MLNLSWILIILVIIRIKRFWMILMNEMIKKKLKLLNVNIFYLFVMKILFFQYINIFITIDIQHSSLYQ